MSLGGPSSECGARDLWIQSISSCSMGISGASSWKSTVMVDWSYTSASGIPWIRSFDLLALFSKSSRWVGGSNFPHGGSPAPHCGYYWGCLGHLCCFSTEVRQPTSLISLVSLPIMASEVLFRALVSIHSKWRSRSDWELSHCRAMGVNLKLESDLLSIVAAESLCSCGVCGVCNASGREDGGAAI